MEIYSKSESNKFFALAALILEANFCTFSNISNTIKGDILAEMLIPKNSCFSLFLRSKLLPYILSKIDHTSFKVSISYNLSLAEGGIEFFKWLSSINSGNLLELTSIANFLNRGKSKTY